jgi:hypothetical protein
MRTNQQIKFATSEEKQAYAKALAKAFVNNHLTDFSPHEVSKIITDCMLGLVHVYGEDGFTEDEMRGMLIMDQLRKAFYQAGRIEVKPPVIG